MILHIFAVSVSLKQHVTRAQSLFHFLSSWLYAQIARRAGLATVLSHARGASQSHSSCSVLPPACQRQNPVHCLWILINQSTYNNNDNNGNNDSGLDFYCAFQGTRSRNDVIGLHLNNVKRSRENVKMMSRKSEVDSVCCKLGHLSLLFTRAPGRLGDLRPTSTVTWLFTIFRDTIEDVRVICIGTLGLHAAALRGTGLALVFTSCLILILKQTAWTSTCLHVALMLTANLNFLWLCDSENEPAFTGQSCLGGFPENSSPKVGSSSSWRKYGIGLWNKVLCKGVLELEQCKYIFVSSENVQFDRVF